MTRLWLLLIVCLTACGNITRKQEDGGVVKDDAGIDAKMDDASIDAPPPKESHEVVSGGARMSGATYTFEVQLGHPIQQSAATGPTYTMEGNAAVKP